MNIRTTTKIFGSFSEAPSNNGASFFNTAFQKNNIDAVYLPVKCSITEDAVYAIKVMNFSGASFSRPHKEKILSLVDEVDKHAKNIGAVNTVLVRQEKLIGFNTDWLGVSAVLKERNLQHLYIYGRGGVSKSVQYACQSLNIDFTLLDRGDEIPRTGSVFNATPSEVHQNNILDGRPFTPLGLQIFQEQAKMQYQLYTGILYA
jgi:shikimate dehydrogenase